MHVVDAHNITKIYSGGKKGREVTALSGFSLAVDSGEIFGLLGPNGAGKTTFIKVLLEIAFATSGSAQVFGKPIGDVETKTRIGYLPENHKYPPYLTGEQVLRYFGKLSGINNDVLDRRIEETLVLVDMVRWSKTKIRRYSKGMMQRIGLAQALVNNPHLIILDEPTDGVDPIGRKQIRDLLTRLRDEGKTIFLNSHLLSEVEMICDRVAILNKGKLIRSGTVKELTQQDHVFVIVTSGPVPDALHLQWEATRVSVVIDGHSHTFTLGTVKELNAIIDQIRSAGVLIEQVSQKHSSLEDMFIDILSKEAT